MYIFSELGSWPHVPWPGTNNGRCKSAGAIGRLVHIFVHDEFLLTEFCLYLFIDWQDETEFHNFLKFRRVDIFWRLIAVFLGNIHVNMQWQHLCFCPSFVCYIKLKRKHFLTCISDSLLRDPPVYVPSQWEMALQCNAISHWLGAYTEWSLHMFKLWHQTGHYSIIQGTSIVLSAPQRLPRFIGRTWLWQAVLLSNSALYYSGLCNSVSTGLCHM